MSSLLRFLTFVGVIALIVAAILLARRDGLRTAERGGGEDALAELDAAVTGLVQRVVPSVVSITASQDASVADRMNRIRGLLGMESSKPQLGSGSIVSTDGHIVTNLHVIAGASDVSVHLSDGRSFPAAFLGADPLTDIAVLKIEAKELRPLTFANSDEVRVGQMVFAIGNPLGLQETVTQGIVSGKGRRALTELRTEFFQTDAAINPGNSGGPLVNVRGEIVGINNAVVLMESQGISFAIPSNLAVRVTDDVVERGRISRPWFGAIAYPLTAAIAAKLGITQVAGNLVVAVLDGSPAARAGILPGDVLQAFNGKPLRDSVDIRNRLAEMKIGDRVETRIFRDGQTLDVAVTVEEQPY
ncbi:MAG: trypsin-like peptidase domain-containing protein [Chthoniobacterales bacterium]